jgi:hypothetical protein
MDYHLTEGLVHNQAPQQRDIEQRRAALMVLSCLAYKLSQTPYCEAKGAKTRIVAFHSSTA